MSRFSSRSYWKQSFLSCARSGSEYNLSGCIYQVELLLNRKYCASGTLRLGWRLLVVVAVNWTIWGIVSAAPEEQGLVSNRHPAIGALRRVCEVASDQDNTVLVRDASAPSTASTILAPRQSRKGTRNMSSDLKTTNSIADYLRRRYSAVEVQALSCVAMGMRCPPTQLPELFMTETRNGRSFLNTVIANMKDKGFDVATEPLLRKLREETAATLIVLAERFERAYAMLATSGIASRTGITPLLVLRHAGLVAPAGKAAWGLVDVTETESLFTQEVVLRKDPRSFPGQPIGSAQEIGEQLMALIRQRDHLADYVSRIEPLAYLLAKKTGWFNIVVTNWKNETRVREITVPELLRDMHAGNCPGLTIQGVNAPTFA